MAITFRGASQRTSQHACIVLALLASACGRAHGQWTVTNLEPDGGPQLESQAFAVVGTEQVGVAGGYAAIWSGTAASWQTIQGPGFSTSQFNATAGGQQVGWVRPSINLHAARWAGTEASFVDLNPPGAFESEALATNGTQQAGWAFINGLQRAVLWNGTAASWIDLNPTFSNESRVFAMSGSQQVGYIINNTVGSTIACLWAGSAGSYVNLNPSGSSNSMAFGTSGLQQVGYASTFDHSHSACVWSGSAGSWVDIGHLAIGSDLSEAFATDGSNQVGLARINDEERAWLWAYPTENVVDLHALLSSDFQYSRATGVWSDGSTTRVCGYGYNATNGRFEALLWTHAGGTCTAPSITTPPAPAEVCEGGSATFSVGASGSTPRTCQWQWRPPGEEFLVVMVNGTNIHPITQQPIFQTPGIGAASVTVTPFAGVLGAGMGIRCVVNNACGSATSIITQLTPSASCCDPIDFNSDTLFPDTTDIADFLTVFAGGVCDGQLPTDPPCNTDIDFNNDGLFPDTDDIGALIRVFGGGACV